MSSRIGRTSPVSVVAVVVVVAAVAVVFLLSEIKDAVGRQAELLADIAKVTRETAASARESASAAKAAATSSGQTAERLGALQLAVAQSRRTAVPLRLDVETPCGNDPECEETARAICSRIGYPQAITSRFTPGPRPALGSLVCFD